MIRSLRLWTGLVLFCFVSLHLTNHMAALWSLEMLEAARRIMHAPWNNPIGKALLYSSLSIHLGLALYALWRLRLKLTTADLLQWLLGFTIPLLLIGHVISTNIIDTFYDAKISYQFVLFSLWYPSIIPALEQLLLLLVVWIHGCLGLYFWLRLKPWYPVWLPYLYAFALLIPIVSSIGFIQGGKAVLALAQDPVWRESLITDSDLPEQAVLIQLQHFQNWFIGIYLGVLALILGVRVLGKYWQQRQGIVKLHYDQDILAQFPPGRSILEASRAAGIPHASVCGGRGRCSTCRVRVVEGLEQLPAASEQELKVLARVKAAPSVRLACQTRPQSGEYKIIRLLPPEQATARDGFTRPSYVRGEERELAILFADLRAFTQLSEQKLPYDVVFLLNQYFASMGTAIETAGGQVDKFIGDGLMALFGVKTDVGTACRAALNAARQMSLNLAELNQLLQADLAQPLRIGIGIHVGTVIVGEMGYAKVRSVTAIGDAVNTASRLESLSKDFQAELVLSQIVADRANIDLSDFAIQETTIRGRQAPIAVRIVPKASELP